MMKNDPLNSPLYRGTNQGNNPVKRLTTPDVEVVRECIENVADIRVRNCLKFIYIAGATRIIEAVGEFSPSDKHYKRAYGPHGSDVQVTEYQPKIPQWAKLVLKKSQLDEAFKPVPVALFTVKIAKKKLAEGEQPYYRIVGLPLPKQYEPWTQDLVDYFEKQGDDLVFPFTRQFVSNYLNENNVFGDLEYPIETYYVTKKLDVVKVVNNVQVNKESVAVPAHQKPYRCHAERHTRVKELRERYGFNGLDLVSYVGWSIRSANRETSENTPKMFGVYGRVYENWRSYMPKLIE